MHSILAQQPNNNARPVILAVFIVMALVMLLNVIVFAKYFRIWMRCFLCRAKVPFLEIVMMSFRKCPPSLICDVRIMSVQAGVPVSTADLQRAYLSGVDIELAVRAMIRAKEIDAELSWDDAVSQARKDQYQNYIDDRDHGD